MKRKTLFLSGILLSFSLIFSCNGNSDSEPEQVTFLCCGDNPFANINVDNLDQSMGEIKAIEVFSANGDGVNDEFFIENIDLYPNNTVTIFDLNDNIVFNRNGYANNIPFNGLDQSNTEELPFGSYKYKIVVENEETFVEYGYICIVRNYSEFNDSSFSNCDIEIIWNDPYLGH
ncbi:gliding motility-associated C-terminal domain-containing protein [Mangrovimonas sp. DI 80]|uniref:T9SS type B sorting domain-containing protein n=1 Tax=Mangrovimonas sp. DI 80 TaxID=1779330 RepID=UPI000975D2EC|nr:gliding motility-associated C-terminal domain-containing protein [Mangrovimonas sp. DI 80]OMP32354.1 hypothetical protein BKM32_04695 [Mangrovimonas sp. DI 80]